MLHLLNQLSRSEGSHLRAAPVLLALFLAALILSSAARASGGTAAGWGNNSYGAVGNGSVSTTGCRCVPAPTPVVGLSEVTQISGGLSHTAALLSDGTARTWGNNGEGQLGNGSTSESPVPLAVPGLSNVVAISAGSEHTLALLSNGTVMAWGGNYYGQLGLGSSTGPEDCSGAPCSKTPLLVPGLSNVIAISAGYDFSLALLADGTVMAWGSDDYGQIGDGVGSESGCLCADHPIPVPQLSGAIAISAGQNISEALLQDGTVKAWGENSYGETGNGTDTPTGGCYCLGPVTVSGLSGVKSVDAGAYHATAVLADGTVKAWGFNLYGQLGDGTKSGPEECSGSPCSRSPVSVIGLSGRAETSAGGNRSTLALLSDGTARGWGNGGNGELGTGTIEESLLPVAVTGLGGASEISASEVGGFALLGPSQTLNIALAGAGSGSVSRRDGTCPSDCTGKYPQGQVAFLRVTPTASGFAGFSGACTGTGTCQVKMDTDQTVTATFGKPKGTKITKVRINKKKRRATFSFTAPGAITGFQCQLVRPTVKSDKRRSKAGRRGHRGARKKPKFATCNGPKAYKHLKSGSYTFRVRALDILGADAHPAERKFKIKVKKPKH